jgi:hypothetical protein
MARNERTLLDLLTSALEIADDLNLDLVAIRIAEAIDQLGRDPISENLPD